ncbi:hypothetical protein DUNSADRAFT_17859 [Dunaliella salina]|uniref:Uncharacterized protein n=1 Tax=Dunaliella salina TaxID=3046 RepID=A0ABQ7G102_DUNSA|nr:hypothetical protein DUNSADRAFT_17859 [Dunaliella salina]|eukprot:KAF5828285.1 hypothetical protein DUNSADRAFT_17859 [Dunaliella salina]
MRQSKHWSKPFPRVTESAKPVLVLQETLQKSNEQLRAQSELYVYSGPLTPFHRKHWTESCPCHAEAWRTALSSCLHRLSRTHTLDPSSPLTKNYWTGPCPWNAESAGQQHGAAALTALALRWHRARARPGAGCRPGSAEE